MPPAKMHGDGRKAKAPKKTFLRLLSYLSKYKLNMDPKEFKPVADYLGYVFTVTAGGKSLVEYDRDALYFTDVYRDGER